MKNKDTMRILKVYPEIDTISRYNYRINFGIWDAVAGDSIMLGHLSSKKLDDYDTVFLPQYKRWRGREDILKMVKTHKIKKVLFDNDSCRRSFTNEFYEGIDFVFYRDLDKDKKTPQAASSFLMWSINTDVYTPRYGGQGVLFNCSANTYPLRVQINEQVKRATRWKGTKYIKAVQASAAAIHTDSPKVPVVRAKILEFAACGTQIISNRTGNMNLYFPDELIMYFDTLDELKEIIKGFSPDIKVQKKLRAITEARHSDKVRANEVLQILEKQL